MLVPWLNLLGKARASDLRSFSGKYSTGCYFRDVNSVHYRKIACRSLELANRVPDTLLMIVHSVIQ